MIIYKDILKQLKDAGYNTTRLRREKLLSEMTINRIRHNSSFSLDSLETICLLLNCQPNDIMEIRPDEAKIDETIDINNTISDLKNTIDELSQPSDDDFN